MAASLQVDTSHSYDTELALYFIDSLRKSEIEKSSVMRTIIHQFVEVSHQASSNTIDFRGTCAEILLTSQSRCQ